MYCVSSVPSSNEIELQAMPFTVLHHFVYYVLTLLAQISQDPIGLLVAFPDLRLPWTSYNMAKVCNAGCCTLTT